MRQQNTCPQATQTYARQQYAAAQIHVNKTRQHKYKYATTTRDNTGTRKEKTVGTRVKPHSGSGWIRGQVQVGLH